MALLWRKPHIWTATAENETIWIHLKKIPLLIPTEIHVSQKAATYALGKSLMILNTKSEENTKKKNWMNGKREDKTEKRNGNIRKKRASAIQLMSLSSDVAKFFNQYFYNDSCSETDIMWWTQNSLWASLHKILKKTMCHSRNGLNSHWIIIFDPQDVVQKPPLLTLSSLILKLKVRCCHSHLVQPNLQCPSG